LQLCKLWLGPIQTILVRSIACGEGAPLTLLDPRGIPISAGFRLKESIMIWETPSFEEIEMNAEIGSYQEDFDGDESPQF